MRYIRNANVGPALSLDGVLRLVSAGNKSPFAEMDTVYTDILSQADDQAALKHILSLVTLHELVRQAIRGQFSVSAAR